MTNDAHRGLCSVADNVRVLRQAYCDTLVALKPESVLDVGCGGGQIMHNLLAHGVICFGLEFDVLSQELRSVIDQAIPVSSARGAVQASALALPFADGSFDWVSMRHVPHHLADPQQAFAEALRVSRNGLFLAEPFFNRDQEDEKLAEDVDLWLKAQHRRNGMIHHPNFVLHDVNQMLAPLGARVSDAQIVSPLGRRCGEELSNSIRAYLQDHALPDADRNAGLELVERLGGHPVTWNGSWLMTVNKV